jgi:hypothetical protein
MLTYQTAVQFGIAVIFPMLIYFGVRTLHPPPKLISLAIHNTPQTTPEERLKATNEQQARIKLFQSESRRHATVLLLASLPLGIAAIVCGAFIDIPAIGVGLIFGGIFSIGNGYFHNWRYLENWVRFVSLLVAFVALLYVAYAKLAH